MPTTTTPPFRTATGQTGHDAYVYEATAIANAQRELNARLNRLCGAIHAEHPEILEHSTDWHPELLTLGEHNRASDLSHYLRGPEHYRLYLRGGKYGVWPCVNECGQMQTRGENRRCPTCAHAANGTLVDPAPVERGYF